MEILMKIITKGTTIVFGRRTRLPLVLQGFLLLVPLLILGSQAFAQNGTWSTLAPMLSAHGASAVGVVNKQLIVATGGGGIDVEAYSPTSNSWTTRATFVAPDREYAIGVGDGAKLYVIGGCESRDCRIGTTNHVDVWNSQTNSWSRTTSLSTPRASFAAGEFNGKIYVVGGQQACPPCDTLSSLEVYDTTTGIWTTKAPMLTPRRGVGAAFLNGKLYVVGGLPIDASPEYNLVEIYDPQQDSWSTGIPLPLARYCAGVVALNGYLYVMGGTTPYGASRRVDVFNPLTNAWSLVDSIPSVRPYLQPQVVDGVIYIAGAFDGSLNLNTDVYAFTPAQTGSGQITIQKTDFEQVFVPNARIKSYFDASQYVNVGNTGGPNVYDFSSLTFPDSVTSTLYQSSQIPQLAARFDPSSLVEGPSLQHISDSPVFFFTENTFTSFANVSVYADTEDYIYKTPNEDLLRFPMTFGLEWSISGAGLGVDSLYINNVSTRTTTGWNTAQSYIVDGYGTLLVKGRSYQCLRVKIVAVDGYAFKGFNYFTKEGVGLLIRSSKDQNDTGVVKVFEGEATMFSPTAVTSVSEGGIIPTAFSLSQNYPNPFNPYTTIRYSLPNRSSVRIVITNTLGQQVAVLENGKRETGVHAVEWRGNVASGIYFYRIDAVSTTDPDNRFTQVKKMLLLK